MNTEASILAYKFRPERTGFNMYAKYTQLKLTFLAFLQNVVYLLCAINITGDMKNLLRFQQLWFYLTKLKSERNS